MIKQDDRIAVILTLQKSKKSSNQENQLKSWLKHLLNIEIK